MIKFFSITLLLLSLSVNIFARDTVAQALKVEGKVDLNRDQQITQVVGGNEFQDKDEIISREKSYAAIKFLQEDILIKLFPNSTLKIGTDENGNRSNFLRMGELWSKIAKTSAYSVETPTNVASVKGTEFLASIDENGETDLFVFAGEVLLTNKMNSLEAVVKEGQKAHSDGKSAIEVLPVNKGDIDKATKKIIDQKIASEPAPESGETPDQSSEDRQGEREKSPSSGQGFNMGGSAGTIMIGDQTYSQIRLMPEISFGKFGIGLDFDLMIDSEGNIREEDWDKWDDYVNKIYYLRYARRGDPFYGRIGGFPSYSLGHGLVMRNYSNMLRYPEVRQIGLQLGGNIPIGGIGIEAFSSNITRNEILGGRLNFQPLNSTSIPLLNKIKFGTTVAHDVNQIKGLLDSDEDNFPDVYDDYPYDKDKHNQVDEDIQFYQDLYSELYPDSSEASFTEWFNNSPTLSALRNPDISELGEDKITILGADYELPLVSGNLFYLSHYGEAAKIFDHNMGFIFPGFYSKFLIFHLNLEYRFYQDDFMPGFFDELYDEQRVAVYYNEDDTFRTKEELIELREKANGWFGRLTTDIFHLLFLTVSYEDMYSESENLRSLWAVANLNTKMVPKLSTAEIRYSQTGFDQLTEFKTDSALIAGKVGYAIGTNTELVGKYQEHYVNYDESEKIEGKEETIKTMNFGVEFRF